MKTPLLKQITNVTAAILILALMSCSKKEAFAENHDLGSKLVDPIALDSMLCADYLIKTNEGKYGNLLETVKCPETLIIYNELEGGKDTLYELHYNPQHLPVSFESKSYDYGKKDFFYDKNNSLVHLVTLYTDIEKITYPIHKHVTYDKYGNLLWVFEYKIIEGKYEFSSYTEYYYTPLDKACVLMYTNHMPFQTECTQRYLQCFLISKAGYWK
jgi:hypothetical protein